MRTTRPVLCPPVFGTANAATATPFPGSLKLFVFPAGEEWPRTCHAPATRPA